MTYWLWREADGIYHIHRYLSKRHHPESDLVTNPSYYFKVHGSGMSTAKAIIETVAEFLERVVVPVPPSGIERSNIEIACKGRVFHRKKPRPRRHDENEISLEVEKSTIKIVDFPVGKDILLVDDICTTGRSISLYKDWCLELGAKSVECLAYGRVKPKEDNRILGIAVIDVGGFDMEDLTDKLSGFNLDDIDFGDLTGRLQDL